MTDKDAEKFPRLEAIRAGNLHELVGSSLPADGEWHSVTFRARKTSGGEIQAGDLLIQKDFILEMKIAPSSA